MDKWCLLCPHRGSSWPVIHSADASFLPRESQAFRWGAGVAECGFPHGTGTELQLATGAGRNDREREWTGPLVPRCSRSRIHCCLKTETGLPFTELTQREVHFSDIWGYFSSWAIAIKLKFLKTKIISWSLKDFWKSFHRLKKIQLSIHSVKQALPQHVMWVTYVVWTIRVFEW